MNMIAIVDKNWGIARDGKQICTIPEDMKRFRDLTMGGTVIMGRKTYEAIGKSLEGRRNIVMSRQMTVVDGIAVACGDAALINAHLEDVFVIGGESIYRQFLPYCDRAYITAVGADLGADQFFPDLSTDKEWRLEDFSKVMTHKNVSYQFRVYERKWPF